MIQNENITIFTPEGMDPDATAIKQLQNCLDVGDEGDLGVLCADHHVGYSQPIGGAVAYQNYISPTGVGFDIGCGNKAVATSLFLSDVKDEMPRIMDEITRRISFGMGVPNGEEVEDHPVYDRINRDAPIPGVRSLLGKARKQLGTVGSGNHYVDLFAEEGTDRIWIGVHFGSRGFGHSVASGFLALAQGLSFEDRAKEGEMNSPPVLFHKDSPLGHLYLESMALAGEYAYAGRDVVVDKVREILGNPAVFHEVHNHHNFLWEEEVHGRKMFVVRKGCTPLYPGQQGFVGGSMGENAVIIEGSTDPGDEIGLSEYHNKGYDSLWSAPHGAGRVMSRSEAKGKSKKRWYCEECGWQQSRGDNVSGIAGLMTCLDCGAPLTKKRWVQETEGKVDWDAARKRLATQGIHLRGGDADEAPEAYKRLPDVIAAHAPYVQIKHSLRPIGVAMAGRGVVDKYKD